MSDYYHHQQYLVAKQHSKHTNESKALKYIPSCLQPTVKSITKSYKVMSCRGRLMKELKRLEAVNFQLPGITFHVTDNLHLIYAEFTFTDHKLFKNGEKFKLKIMFSENYPFVAPVCIFVIDQENGINNIPMNPHIYSNGHICLDLLGPAWTPVHTVESLALSIQSMLNGNELNERPPDDKNYVKFGPKDPSKTKFDYHDETV